MITPNNSRRYYTSGHAFNKKAQRELQPARARALRSRSHRAKKA